MNWQSYGGGGNFLLVPQNSPILVKGNFAYSRYKITLKPESAAPKSSSINGFNMGLNFTYFMGKNEVDYGFEVLGFRTDFDLYNSVNRHISQVESTTEIGGFAKYKYVSKNRLFVIEPSFRLQYYASLSNISPEPRLNFKVNVTPRFRLKGATGMYSQNLIAANSDRDVVNLFYGFLSGPDDAPKMPDGTAAKSKLQKANHYVAGFEYDITKHWDLNVEAYLKDFKQLTNLNPAKLKESDPDFINETGKAKGVDVVLKYEYKRLYLWFVYSLTYVTRYDGLLTDDAGNKVSYHPNFDRRHNANVVASYTFGKDRNWEVDARWSIGSGFPFKPTGGFYENITFKDDLITNYTTNNGDLNYFFDGTNVKRLPWYHRLDINVKRTFLFAGNTKLEVAVGATNVYNRENIFYFDRVLYKRVDQLPILPTASLILTF